MAFKHGRAVDITVNSVVLSTFCDSADLNIDVDTSDTTTFGSTWKTAIAGLVGGTLELAGNFDPTTTTGPASAIAAVIAGGAPVAVIYEPGGAASNQGRTFNALVTNYKESSPVADKVTFSCSLLVTAAVTFES